MTVFDVSNYDKMKDGLYITMSGKDQRITVWRDIVRILGYPKYVCVRVNTARTAILLKPCEAKDVMAFKVPDNLFAERHVKFRISSKDFISDMLANNGYDNKISYNFKGYYSATFNSVVVPLENGVHSPWQRG